ncbi:hypothetical protein CI109_105550 [Kwoniella shandongensis]|uniref:GPI inositol-deacylase transmembrane domain-containing protein n=1 Tax=Kwoniella shandongensis TaxID=1734106 RepID=A0AAJ8LQP8_9TREE
MQYQVLWASVVLTKPETLQVVGTVTVQSALTSKATSANLSFAVIMLTLFILPFKATGLLVWGRSLWTNWSHPFTTDHNLFYIIPSTLVVALSSQGAALKKRDLILQGCRYALIVLAVVAFTLGSRWTWLLPSLVNVVLIFIVGILW